MGRVAAPLASADEQLPTDAIEVGRVLGAWGVHGQIRVAPFSAQPDALLACARWFIRPADPPGRWPASATPPGELLNVTRARRHGDSIVAAARELPDRDAAESIKGARVFVARSSFPVTAEGEYYWVDLIGLEVLNRQGATLGTVTDLLDTGAHCVLRIRRPDAGEGAPVEERERLIPFVEAYVDEVRLAERRIVVDWGLDY